MIFFIIFTIICLYLAWRLYFLRNPKRTVPKGAVAVAPADGYVVYIKKVVAGEVPLAIKKRRTIRLSELSAIEESPSGTLIGIFMTANSVHRNRIPLAGKVVFQKHKKNQLNLSMVRPLVETFMRSLSEEPHPEKEYLLTNERLTTGIETEKGTYFITQIADPWINRIISWVKIGERVEKGIPFGMIRFGSQCDLFLPDSLEINLTIKKGDYVYAGETILGNLTHSK